MTGPHLTRCRLVNTTLSGATLTGTAFIGAEMYGALLLGAVANAARMQGALLNDAILDGANLQGADLKGADLRRAWMQDCESVAGGEQSKGKYDPDGAPMRCASCLCPTNPAKDSSRNAWQGGFLTKRRI